MRENPNKVYEGRPCSWCGNTLRYKSNGKCVYGGRADHRSVAALERRRATHREWYWDLSGLEYNRQLLMSRRRQGLRRMAKRQARREEEYGALSSEG